MADVIKIRGARQHNLKNIDVDIPKNKFVVFTGVSGSGKSSLAHDTIYAEGQRRYVESLSTYARQFLGIMEKPEVDLIEGLSPAISIDQKTTSKNPRSTVGTVTEIYDYLRLLFARVGHPHCPICGREIARQSLDQIVEASLEHIRDKSKRKKQVRFLVLSPVVRDKKGEFTPLFDNLRGKGFKQIRIDGYIKDLSDDLVLIKTNKHTIEVIVDKLTINSKDFKGKIYRENLKSRLSDSIEQALKLSDGLVILAEILDKSFEMPQYPKKFSDTLFSERFACPVDNIQIPEIEPRTFSFNSPHGACPTCNGIGKILKVEPDLVFSPEISITEGGILPFKNMFEHDTWYARLVLAICRENEIDPRTPVKNLSNEKKDLLLQGTGDREYRVEGTNRFGRMTYIYEAFPGILAELEKRHSATESDWIRSGIEKYMREKPCPECGGARLKKEALGVTIDKLSIADTTSYTITEALSWINLLMGSNTLLSERDKSIGKLILREISARLTFLASVGIEYLTLDRPSATLSGGEAQRIRLASQIGSGLSGVLYVLDEPTIGLHQRDNKKLINTLKKLRDLGNTVVVVEHDREMINSADHIIDFGPGAGKEGGEIVVTGSPAAVSKNGKSITGKFLSGKRKVEIGDGETTLIAKQNSENIEEGNGKVILYGCSLYNLKNIDVEFPLGKLIVITGVSGSGKSTLLVETLYPALMQSVNRFYRGSAGQHKKLDGVENVDKAILIDQSPIGRTPRSNPATYTKLFDHIREIYAQTREARAAGFKKGRFSFNVRGGRCEACEGQGQNKIEMQFMSDLWVTCEVCEAKRYNAQTLEVNYRGKNIAEVLEMTVTEAKEFFHAHPNIVKKLDTLEAVGLGYMELGQSATTLSGGEAQRVKLSSELAKKATGKTVYILDEPTTGLHFADVEKLLRVLKMLVNKGNSVFIIEHNLDVIRNADWIIDLGPEGGDEGGKVVAEGTVENVKKVKKSYTGQFLSKVA
ncbi:excinuclease ABC subunit UvrA [Patescibacteria group bacterium]|nr:excinuclease ABC subunit UvrA [Patescibacteria group bacterium]